VISIGAATNLARFAASQAWAYASPAVISDAAIDPAVSEGVDDPRP
jgi:hypothetical protein